MNAVMKNTARTDPGHRFGRSGFAAWCAFLLLFLGAFPASADVDVERTAHYVGGPIHAVQIVKINHRQLTQQPYYLVGVIDSDRHLKLIGFRAGDLAGPIYVERKGDARTTGPAGLDFAIAEMKGIVLTVFKDREDEFRVTTWDATHWDLSRIRRLDDWEGRGQRIYRAQAIFLRQIDGFYRFATAVSDANRNQRIDVWDVEPSTGRIHHRGHAVGGRVGELSLTLLEDNVIDLNKPTLIATVATDANSDLWTRIWTIDRAGNVSQGAGMGGGRAYQVGVVNVGSMTLLASVREGEGRLKMIAFKVGNDGGSIDRLPGDHLVPGRVFDIAACPTNSAGHHRTAVQDYDGELAIYSWSVLGLNIVHEGTNRESGAVDRVACAGDVTLLVAAVRDSDHKLRVILYQPAPF